MKINGDMTLFELKEHCNKTACIECEFNIFKSPNTVPSYNCLFRHTSPEIYNLYKPKTYKEDFLDKFPKAIMDEFNNHPRACAKFVYGLYTDLLDVEDCPYNYDCKMCWNQFIPEEEINEN